MQVLEGSESWWTFESFELARRQRALSDEHPRGRGKHIRGWEVKAERAGRTVQNFAEEIGQER
jgi:hypothetical protein